MGPGSQGPRNTRWRRTAIGAAAIVAAALALVFVWPRSGAQGGRAVAAAPVRDDPSAPGAAKSVAAAQALPESVQRYLEATVYPPDSGRLTEGHYDLLNPNSRYERPRPIADSIADDPAGVVRYLLTADRYHLEAGGAARATLQAWRGSTPVPGELEIVEATLVAEGCLGAEGPRAAVSFAPRGDALEADLPLSRFEDHHGSVLLEVQFTAGDIAEVQRDQLRFFHTPAQRIPAELLPGRFRDSVRDGSLRLEFGVDVRDPGFYRFDANLFGPAGQPVAFASFKGELGSGGQSVAMQVYGKVLRDAGVPGPYRVDQLRGYRFLDGHCPDRENLAALGGGFTTAAYRLDVFTDEPHTSEHKQRMIEMMLADEARGIAPEFPPLPPPGEGGAPPVPDDDYEPPPAVTPRGS